MLRVVVSERPVVLACPYLPLRRPVEFSGWWLGPLDQYKGTWARPEFESRVRQFLRSFRVPGGGEIDNPSLLARLEGGANGDPPTSAEQRALEQVIAYATIDSNPWWKPGAQGWAVATTDNADLWVQPITLENGAIALDRGGRVRTMSGGYSLDDEAFLVPGPLELQVPFDVGLDAVILEAAYEVVFRPAPEHAERCRRIATAMRWVTKSWFNSASISESDRIVLLKTASEALTGETRGSLKAAAGLRGIFEEAVHQEGGGLGVDDLLWSPVEPSFVRIWSNKNTALSAIEHWYMALADARNDVVHALASPTLTYEHPGSPYDGPLVEVADRVLREAIAVELGACGYPEAWRRGLTRASMATLRRLRGNSA